MERPISNDLASFVVVRAKVPLEIANLALEAAEGHVWHAIDICTEDSEQVEQVNEKGSPNSHTAAGEKTVESQTYRIDDESRAAILRIASQGGCSQEQAHQALNPSHGDREQARAAFAKLRAVRKDSNCSMELRHVSHSLRKISAESAGRNSTRDSRSSLQARVSWCLIRSAVSGRYLKVPRKDLGWRLDMEKASE